MPFEGFICEVEDARHSPQSCLACAMQGSLPGCHFTPPLLRGIVRANGPRGYVGWSTTQLTCCPRKSRLRAKLPWYARPSEMYWAWRGQIGHGAVGGAHGLEHVISEVRFAAYVDDTLVTGTPDVVYVDRRHLQDYKTCKEVPGKWYTYTCPTCGQVMQEGRWRLRNGNRKTCPHCKTRHEPHAVKAACAVGPPRPYAGHVAQLSVYRWLLANNGLSVDTAELVYLDMERPKRLPVELWSLDHTGDWIASRLPALTAPDLPPPLAQDDDDSWQCRYCPVVDACKTLIDGGSE